MSGPDNSTPVIIALELKPEDIDYLGINWDEEGATFPPEEPPTRKFDCVRYIVTEGRDS